MLGTGTPLFFAYMNEREAMRQRKESGEDAPWTVDPILRNYYFTNVMREHDRVSRWIQEHITDRFRRDADLPVMLGVARWLNHIATLEWLLKYDLWWESGEGDSTTAQLKTISTALDRRRDAGAQIFGGAYVISANGMRWGDWQSKHAYVVEGVVGDMAMAGEAPLGSMQAFTEWLDAVPGWGGFMAYEVACDLRWAPGWLAGAPDIYSWANPGPGAARGLQNIYGQSFKGNSRKESAIEAMRDLLQEANEWAWQVQFERPLEMRDIEHSLCEFNKYVKIMEGGRAKRRYVQR